MHWHWVYITSILYIVPDLYMLCYVRILFGLVLQLGPLATCVQADGLGFYWHLLQWCEYYHSTGTASCGLCICGRSRTNESSKMKP